MGVITGAFGHRRNICSKVQPIFHRLASPFCWVVARSPNKQSSTLITDRVFAPTKFRPESSFLAGFLRFLADSGHSGRKKIDRQLFLVATFLAESCEVDSLCVSSRIIESVVDSKCYRGRPVLEVEPSDRDRSSARKDSGRI